MFRTLRKLFDDKKLLQPFLNNRLELLYCFIYT